MMYTDETAAPSDVIAFWLADGWRGQPTRTNKRWFGGDPRLTQTSPALWRMGKTWR
jgi:hypothetical protein